LIHYYENEDYYKKIEALFRRLYDGTATVVFKELPRTCGNCRHSSPDKYRPHIPGARVCWRSYRFDGIIRRVNEKDRACSDFYSYKTLVQIVSDTWEPLYTATDSYYIIESFNERPWPDNYIYLLYRIIPNPTRADSNKIKSVLKNVFGYDLRFNIGKGGRKYEEYIRSYYKRLGYKLLPSVFKIEYYDRKHPSFKVMDLYFRRADEHVIIEVFTSYRFLEEKIQQINDYEFLLRKTGVKGKIVKKLVTDQKVTEKMPQGIKVMFFKDPNNPYTQRDEQYD